MNMDKNRSRALALAVRNLLWWVLASVAAIGLLEINPFLGLGVALAGGVTFGLILFQE